MLILLSFASHILSASAPVAGWNELNIEKKCMLVARNYAQKHPDSPWSKDARFGYVNSYICTVYVSQVGYDGNLCYPSYVIDLRTWKVTQINFAGCIDQN